MNKSEMKILLILLLIFLVLAIVLFVSNGNSDDIKLNDVEVNNKEILDLPNRELNICIKGLIKYLNKKKYYVCDEIDFYKNTFDDNNNYFYALVIGADESLIEITYLGESDFKYRYVGNQLTPDKESKETGVSYNQIINPEQYKKDKKLEEMREKMKESVADDDEIS